jgi:mono/diheme cytochrome c family protein
MDVQALFASTCGFCHGDGGRSAGKGPQLMDTMRSDEFLRDRIKNGKEGALPAFG